MPIRRKYINSAILVIIFMELLTQTEGETVLFKANLLKSGKVQYDGSVGQSTETNLSRCVIACSKNKKCLSFMYKFVTGVCIQHSKTFKYQDPNTNEFGWKMYLYIEKESNCPSALGFYHYRHLNICYNFNAEHKIDYEGHILPTCLSYGAELMRIDSQERQTYIEHVLVGRPTTRVAIQGYSYNPGYKWTLFDGTPLPYTNWARAPLIGNYYLQMFINSQWTEKGNSEDFNTNIFMCEIR